jgi:hypothetical protein
MQTGQPADAPASSHQRLHDLDALRAATRSPELRAILKATLHPLHKNPENLPEWQPERRTELDLKHLEGIPAHWACEWLSTGYLVGLNSVFSAVKREVRNYRSHEHMIARLCFVAGKLYMPSPASH